MVVSTGMEVVQDRGERYVSDVDASQREAPSCQSVRRQARMQQPLSRSFPPRRSEISRADQHREAAIVTGRRTSLSPLCH